MNASPHALTPEFRCELPPAPYPGLRPFEPDEWPIFFGRETMADEVIARIVRDRLLVVHGDSGCGKSSLIYAGVLPHLEQEAARSGVRWRTCAAFPGDQPLDNLAAALAALEGSKDHAESQVAMRRLLNYGREGAAVLIERLGVSPTNRVCILIDQFEELFAHAKLHGQQEASLLVEFLIGIQETATPGLSAVLTMRSEFLGACAKFQGFAEAVNAAQYLLPRMAHADLLRAIREPATLYNGDIELTLAENLIADVGGMQDQLPLIQHGLMMLHRDQVVRAGIKPDQKWRLTLENCPLCSRGLSRMLSDHASEVAVTVGHSQVVEGVFRALTDMNSDGHAVRRPRTLGQLVAVTGAPEDVVRNIVDTFRVDGVSLLRPYGTRPLTLESRIDISHEALIRCWRRISTPEEGWLLREFKDGLIWRSLLVQAESFEKDSKNVLSAATTEERDNWLKERNAIWAERYGGGWQRVRKLIDASIAERDRQLREQEEDRKREQESRIQKLQLEAKARSVRVLRRGAILTLALAAAGIAAAIYAFKEKDRAEVATRIANQEQQRAESARQAAEYETERSNQARVRAEERSRVLEESVAKLESNTAMLSSVLKTLPTDAKTGADIQQAQSNIQHQVGVISSVATPPRIYVHISSESQREAARELVLRIEKMRIGKDLIVVPGIELKAYRGNEIRCFVAAECKEAAQLADVINKLLRIPKVKVADAVGRGAAANLRARHYELWLGPGNIELEGSRVSLRTAQQFALADTAKKETPYDEDPDWSLELADDGQPPSFHSRGRDVLAMTLREDKGQFIAERTWTIRNPLKRPVRIGYSDTGESRPNFALAIGGSCNGATLHPGDTCSMNLRFEPERRISSRFTRVFYLYDLDEPKSDEGPRERLHLTLSVSLPAQAKS